MNAFTTKDLYFKLWFGNCIFNVIFISVQFLTKDFTIIFNSFLIPYYYARKGVLFYLQKHLKCKKEMAYHKAEQYSGENLLTTLRFFEIECKHSSTNVKIHK